jgi:hypothetical protein
VDVTQSLLESDTADAELLREVDEEADDEVSPKKIARKSPARFRRKPT